MDISHESPNETEQRLRRVIANADLYVFPDDYTFVERDIESFPAILASRAIALVRDRDVWSALSYRTGNEHYVRNLFWQMSTFQRTDCSPLGDVVQNF